ncbi:unnamed protein product [Bursaphelenchus xylophilus]|uniref:(pine wood nematode) hypothetical protein n=1 Tax=Bursaphelenchus xylophilus TaxID=6326 RepID=A0A1I7RVY1_BURXY|nr:unnamed protein product [Bursaphelenchus xylophilus]CAG9094867.1 unnamed protein product [Bursaphelenchus xylophilus]
MVKVATVLLLSLALVVDGVKLPSLGKLQSAAVKGRLLCDRKPYAQAKIKMYDEDFGELDDLMDTKFSDKNGAFLVSGHETEFTPIDVKINIYHNCDDEQKECYRKISIKIPDNFITEGKTPKKTFDVGTINLNAKFAGETRDCLN